jgi:hypothetical protein
MVPLPEAAGPSMAIIILEPAVSPSPHGQRSLGRGGARVEADVIDAQRSARPLGGEAVSAHEGVLWPGLSRPSTRPMR